MGMNLMMGAECGVYAYARVYVLYCWLRGLILENRRYFIRLAN